MLERDTTFILGAGASFDLDFPLGDTLRDRIINLLRIEGPNRSINFADPILSQIIQRRAMEESGPNGWETRMEVYRRAAATIRDGLPFARSIDVFLDGMRHTEHVEFLGKLAIATSILRAEASSPLIPYREKASNAEKITADRLKKLLGSWHTELSQILFDGHTIETLPTVFEHAAFIVFNYDRCLEEFLTIALMRRFNISRADAHALVATCQIIHPYGQVGAFLPSEEGYIPFGKAEDRELLAVAASIRTFTETMESRAADSIKERVAQAETLVFMGFGWLPQNMELLQIGDRDPKMRRVFATTMQMAKGETDVVEDQIFKMLLGEDYALMRKIGDYEHMPAFIFEQGDCKSLMRNCWLRLTN